MLLDSRSLSVRYVTAPNSLTRFVLSWARFQLTPLSVNLRRSLDTACGLFARSIPLAFTPSIADTLRLIQSLRKKRVSWDAPYNGSIALLLTDVAPLIDTVVLPFTTTRATSSKWLEVFSDAMADSNKFTWAFTSGEHVEQGIFSAPHHIFLLELVTAAESLFWASRHSSQAILYTDNTAVLFALRAGHCGNSKVDVILKHLFQVLPFSFRFKVAHVCSSFNIAHQYTRGCKGQEGPPAYVTLG